MAVWTQGAGAPRSPAGGDGTGEEVRSPQPTLHAQTRTLGSCDGRLQRVAGTLGDTQRDLWMSSLSVPWRMSPGPPVQRVGAGTQAAGGAPEACPLLRRGSPGRRIFPRGYPRIHPSPGHVP